MDVNVTQSSLLVEMLEGIRVVKAFGLESQQVERFRKLSRELVHYGMKGIRAREQINPIIETFSMLPSCSAIHTGGQAPYRPP